MGGDAVFWLAGSLTGWRCLCVCSFFIQAGVLFLKAVWSALKGVGASTKKKNVVRRRGGYPIADPTRTPPHPTPQPRGDPLTPPTTPHTPHPTASW